MLCRISKHLGNNPEGYEKLASIQLPQIITIKGKGSITYTHDVVGSMINTGRLATIQATVQSA